MHQRKRELLEVLLPHLVPLVGVWFLGWDYKLIILTYFVETAIFVVFHSVRLWLIGLQSTVTTTESQSIAGRMNDGVSPAFMPLFNLALFGMFTTIQLFVMGGFTEKVWKGGIFSELVQAVQGPLFWALVIFAAMQVQQILVEYLTESYRSTTPDAQLFRPFRRIFTQQLVVILGGFFMFFGSGKAYMYLLVALNIGFDLGLFYFIRYKLAATKNLDADTRKSLDELERMMRK